YLPSHHLLKLVEINATITVFVDLTNHLRTVSRRALLSQSLHDSVQFMRRYQAVLVEIVQIERVLQFLIVTIGTATGVEFNELVEVNVAITVLVDLLHYASKLV
ncbi:hypothetical protein CFOL_v3_34217, partial [Cephalotus follicularis]